MGAGWLRVGTGSPGQWVIWVICLGWVTGSSLWPGMRPDYLSIGCSASYVIEQQN